MKKFIILIAILAAAVIAGWYFRVGLTDFIVNSYDQFFNIKETSLNQLFSQIEQIKKEILTPSPLRLQINFIGAKLTRAGVINWTNEQRKQNNLGALLENAQLDASALAKAQDMLQKQYFEHISPTGAGPDKLAEAAGYDFIVLGENLALGNFKDDQTLVQAWMNSPGHRANILGARFSEIGVAVIKGEFEGQTTWLAVQEFGLPLSTCPQPSAALKAQIVANEKRLAPMLNSVNAERQAIDNLSKRDTGYNREVAQYNNLIAEYNSLIAQTKAIISQYNSQVGLFNSCSQGS